MAAHPGAKQLLGWYRYAQRELLRDDLSEHRREVLTAKALHYRGQLVRRFGEHFGECSRCHALLVDPVSVAAAMGPECRQKERASA